MGPQYRSTIFAALQYDEIKLLDHAVAAVRGKVENKDAFRAALRKADFHSIRGPFRFNNNHFPIQNVYICKCAELEGGRIGNEVLGTVERVQDPG